MVKLTEDMVVARSKGSELHNVKKLNCWGSELSDVSVVRKLPNVEVLSMSVNNISTLEDFQYCQNLQELYIRKNNIVDINEVIYLLQLPKLKSLWLVDNPCSDFPEYRMTVLRALPHLQKLDNITVESEDVQKALVCGLPLPIKANYASVGRSESPASDSTIVPNTQNFAANSNLQMTNSRQAEYEYAGGMFHEDMEQPQQLRRSSLVSDVDTESQRRMSANLFAAQRSPHQRSYELEGGDRGSEQLQKRWSADNSLSREEVPARYDSPVDSRGITTSINHPAINQTLRHYHEHDSRSRNDTPVRSASIEFSRRSPKETPQREQTMGDLMQAHYDSVYRRIEAQQDRLTPNLSRSSLSLVPSPRQRTRNTNVLSAVLCLIKDLDYSDLEVVENSIRCRMQELED